jgi:glycine cleavage system H protein
MASVKNCNLPDELYYNVENNVWCRPEADGTVTVGMTAYAAALAGDIVAFTPKKAGKTVEQNKSVATVESAKWVGPVKSPVTGEVVATNEAVAGKPNTVNGDPYGNGWLVRMKPANWAGESGALVTGGGVVAAFEAKMTADGFAGC